jgi:hypothetical protein
MIIDCHGQFTTGPKALLEIAPRVFRRPVS